MVASPRLGFTYLAEGETVPETAVNEIASILEAAGNTFTFLTFGSNTPPASPAQGDTHWTGSSPTGTWSGQAGKIAIWVNTAWLFITAREGMLGSTVGGGLNRYDGTAWVEPTVGAGSVSIQLAVEEDGVEESASVNRLNFTGSVDVTVASGEATINVTGSSGVSEAPIDGTGYVRKDGAWAAEAGGASVPSAYSWRAVPSVSTPQTLGLSHILIGTANNYPPASGSLYSVVPKWRTSAGSTVNTNAGTRSEAIVLRGDAATPGGFTFTAIVGTDNLGANSRYFVGLTAAAALVAGDPSAEVNMIGFGVDAADTNWQIFHNDGAGTATKVDTGIAARGHQKLYKVTISCESGASTMTVSVIEYSASGGVAASFSTSPSTDLPVATTLLGPKLQVNSGSSGAVQNIAIVRYDIDLGFVF